MCLRTYMYTYGKKYVALYLFIHLFFHLFIHGYFALHRYGRGTIQIVFFEAVILVTWWNRPFSSCARRCGHSTPSTWKWICPSPEPRSATAILCLLSSWLHHHLEQMASCWIFSRNWPHPCPWDEEWSVPPLGEIGRHPSANGLGWRCPHHNPL